MLVTCFCLSTQAQTDKDTTKTVPPTILDGDSIPVIDSLSVDTMVSPDALTSTVEYTAKDSIVFDLENKKIYLYGSASVGYEAISLDAARITIQTDSNTVIASPVFDTAGVMIGRPKFSDGTTTMDADTMKYNFKTKKGRMSNAVTQEGEGFIHVKVGKKLPNDNVYIKDGKYTTCNLDHPHFYIGTTRLKVIPEDKIITGPACLFIEDVPTPLAVPFGYFPNKKGKASGLIIPTYGESPNLGFYLQNGGYYWSVNDYVDMQLTGDIYSKGSWGSKFNTQYKKRYKFGGNLNLSYSNIRSGFKETPDFSVRKEFFVRWKHSQDAKARPNSRFSADVNAGTSSNFTNNFNSVTNDFLTNTFTSSVSYNKTFAGTPFTAAVNARHSQNTQTRQVNVSLPEASFNMSRVYPVQMLKKVFGAKGSATNKGLDKLGLSYALNVKNDITTHERHVQIDDLAQLTDSFRNGIKHNIPIGTNFKLFKYFTLNPNANFTAVQYFNFTEKTWDNVGNKLVETKRQQFVGNYRYNLATNLTTKLYGTKLFKGGPIAGVRHVVTPTVGLSYQPENSTGQRSYVDSISRVIDYNIFEDGIFGNLNTGEAGNVNFSILNNLEMKVRTPKDSADPVKKIKLLENVGFSGSYNLMADSLNWSNFNLNARTRLFNNVSLNFNSRLDPYQYSQDSITGIVRKVDRTWWEDEFKLGHLSSANLAIAFTLKSKTQSSTAGYKPKDDEDKKDFENVLNNPNAFVDFTIPWQLSVNYNVNYTKSNPFAEKSFTQTVNFAGEVNLTPKWRVEVASGYDFVAKDFSYTTVNFYRDLHCWEMSFRWVPFGTRKSYEFQINVKSSVLQDLKLSRRREYFDLAQPF